MFIASGRGYRGVDCRIGSSEIYICPDGTHPSVDCRIGSSERPNWNARSTRTVDCRVGSSEITLGLRGKRSRELSPRQLEKFALDPFDVSSDLPACSTMGRTVRET